MSERRIGTVIRSTGTWSIVMLDDRSLLDCRLRGHYRLKGLRTTSPISVGDKVEVLIDSEDASKAVIDQIHERQNYIIRKSVNLSKEAHIIASNMDQALIIATVHQPRTSYGFIDRFLSTAEAYNIKASVLINKVDLNTSAKHIALQKELTECYTSIGYKVLTASSIDGTGIDMLRKFVQNKVTLISGHSGVGKSTLINQLQPDLDIRTAEISEAHHKGTHTTTFAEMHVLKNNGFIIDTPGIKEFGMIDMNRAEVSHYFPEIFDFSAACKFNNCQHTNEPGCAVVAAVNANQIPNTRHSSYISILESLK